MLLDSHKNIKIVDFGLSNTYSQVSQKKKSAIVIEGEQEEAE
jgi:hypothetical protein